ncbi:MAG: MlaD family protein [Desulfovibrionales bacterium]
MTGKSTYFKVGLFLLIGLALLTAALVFFGLSSSFQETIPAESYFDYSVEGLETGSMVKYRGVDVGRVADIGLVVDEYPDASPTLQRHVLVRMDLFRKRIKAFADDEPIRSFHREIEKGLRVRVSVQGLTGGGYLALDYLSPNRNPVPTVTWEPDSLYIPSAPSTLSRVENMLDTFSGTMERIDFESLVDSLGTLMGELNRVIEGAGEEDLARLLAQTLTETRDLTARLNQIVGQPEAMTIIPRAANAAENVEALTQDIEGDLTLAVQNIRQASEVIVDIFTDPGLQKGLSRLPGVMENISSAAEEISQSADVMSSTASNLNELTINQRRKIDTLLENLNAAARNFQELSEEFRRNPSSLFFSRPPEQSPLDR